MRTRGCRSSDANRTLVVVPAARSRTVHEATLPGWRDIENPAHRNYIAQVWEVPEPSIPHNGLSAVPLLEAIHDGRIKGLLLICFNPAVSLPDGDFIREALGRSSSSR